MKKIVVFTGAGVSRESGVPTYRDTDGIWNKYDPDEVVSIGGWATNPEKVIEFHNLARREMCSVEPNEAHKIIAELEEKYDVTVVTQNIDDLHERAGSTKVNHLHGEIFKIRDMETGEVLECREDTSLEDGTRPHVVWFGEQPFLVDESVEAIEQCDILIVIGTSLFIGYIPWMLNFAVDTTERFWCVDPNPSPILMSFPDVDYIRNVATVGMNEIKNILMG